MPFQKVLLKGQTLAAGSEKRLLPCLDVSKWERLHLHISNVVPNLSVRVLVGTPFETGMLLAGSTVWFENTVSEREFSYTTPSGYNKAGFIMSIPVVAPMLYDVILKNLSANETPKIWVTLLAK